MNNYQIWPIILVSLQNMSILCCCSIYSVAFIFQRCIWLF